MKKGRLYTKDEIELISKSAIGKTVNDILNEEIVTIEDENSKNKGEIGQLIERYLFGIKNNNDSEPDFMPAGIELKVTAYKKLKNGELSSKERLTLNVLDYESEYKNTFETSHFLFKNNNIQLLWYLWEPNKKKRDYVITHEKFLKLSECEDIKQIKKDWEYIINKIKAGKAHEISEADTMYLSATTKGANSKQLREQPFNTRIKAKQRAFALKTTYMTQLVRKNIGNYSDVERILNNTSYTFDEYINKSIAKYIGKTKTQLKKEFSIKTEPKNILSIIINRMFNVKSRLKDTDEFLKANIIPKTIRIEPNGNIIESMSFPYFRFDEVMNTDFEDSELRDILETTKYMFFVFKEEKGEYVFKGVKLWNMPEAVIDSTVKSVYDKTRKVIKDGLIVNHIDKRGRRITNFPGMSDNGVCHVRPHGRNSLDTIPLPVADKFTGMKEYTKQCFWFNNSYLKEIFKEYS